MNSFTTDIDRQRSGYFIQILRDGVWTDTTQSPLTMLELVKQPEYLDLYLKKEVMRVINRIVINEIIIEGYR